MWRARFLDLEVLLTREETIHVIDSILVPKPLPTDRPVSGIPPTHVTMPAPVRRPTLPAETTVLKLYVIILMLSRHDQRVR